jgi:hypothetical protein
MAFPTQSFGYNSPIPSGSVFLVYQAAAPAGWTQVTSINDHALRIVSSSGGNTGGTTAFSTVFNNQTPTIGATTLSVSQMPSHGHSIGGGGGYGLVNGGGDVSAGGDKGAAGIDGNGGSTSHTHSSSAITLNVQYANVILCSKN